MSEGQNPSLVESLTDAAKYIRAKRDATRPGTARVSVEGELGLTAVAARIDLAIAELLARDAEIERLRGELKQAAHERDRYKGKVERDPVWFVPDKIVAHAGRCFKLRVDDDGPKLVMERTAMVTTRLTAEDA